jgi:fucose permease
MAQSHGTWSLTFRLVTGLSALAIRAGVTPLQQFVTLAAIMLAGIFLFIRPMQDAPPDAHQRPGSRFILPNRATFLLMGYGVISVVVEIVVRNWAIIIVRDIFAPPGWIAACALPVFVGLQTAGRFLSDRVAARIGDVALGRAFCAMTAAGLVMLALAPSVWAALLACAVIGLGTSATYPLTVTAVVRRGDRPATEAVAAFIFLQNILAAAAPVVFGAVAGLSDPRIAVALLLPVVAVAYAFSRELGPQASSAGFSSSRA